ncbi:hypothetical protein COCNU_scaffold002499G000040 [Cocos nucifera]|nr:hypothetical protein [Cocos nucifera]
MGHPGKSHLGVSNGSSSIANGRVPGCTSHGQGARDLCSGDPNPGPPCRCALAGGPRAGQPGTHRADSGHGSTAHDHRAGMEGSSTPECWPRPCWDAHPMGKALGTFTAGARIPGQAAAFIPYRCVHSQMPYRVHIHRAPTGVLGCAAVAPPTTPEGHPGKSHPGGSMGPSSIANGRVSGCASRGQGSQDLHSGDPNLGPPDARMGRQRARKHRARPPRWGRGEQHVHSAPEGWPRSCDRGAPYHPDGASRQVPPQGFQRIERHCKRAGVGMRISWAWRSGPMQQGPKSSTAPPLRMGGPIGGMAAWRMHGLAAGREAPRTATATMGRSGAARAGRAHGRALVARQWRPLPPQRGIPTSPTPGVPKDRGTLQVGGGRDACTSAACPRVGLGRATEAPPTTPMGHLGKPHPGVSKGSSSIANGRVPGCASHGQGARDPHSGDPNLGPPHRCSRAGWPVTHLGRQGARKHRDGVEGLGCTAMAPPTTPAGHPGKSHPEGSDGSSGIANGWWPGMRVPLAQPPGLPQQGLAPMRPTRPTMGVHGKASLATAAVVPRGTACPTVRPRLRGRVAPPTTPMGLSA